MGRIVRPALALVLALFMRPGPTPRPAAAAPVVEQPGDEGWYEPQPEDFRPHYDRDLANGGKQTWEQYWSWVKLFYTGNFFTKGWNDRARWLLEEVRSEDERNRIRGKINAIGRDICAEWSKDYDVRKIGSADLLSWGQMLEQARGSDGGTGARIHRAIEEIRKDHRRKLDGGGSAPR